MEPNPCDINHFSADALLPPRKRLLAGLKRQNSAFNFFLPSTSTECDARLNHLLSSQLNNPILSNEEIAEASRISALEAARIAKIARSNAEEKAAKAAKAVAAAKSALELVERIERNRRKRNKTKKQNVQALYGKNKGGSNSRTDEEVARNLQSAINSSPRILKNRKNKRLKSNENGAVDEIDTIKVDLNTLKIDKLSIKSDLGKLENVRTKDQVVESFDGVSKKRGRIKQKKLPLSICNFREQTGLKDQQKTEDNEQFPSVERKSTWKCQAFKTTHTCVEQNNVIGL